MVVRRIKVCLDGERLYLNFPSKLFQLSSTFKEKELSDRVEKELDNKFVECEYCHSTFDIKLSKCPTCGAPKNLNNAK